MKNKSKITKAVSLAPSTFVTGTSFDLTEIRAELRAKGVVDDDIKGVKIENCPAIVKWNLKHVAEKACMSVAEAAFCIHHRGVRRLWQLPGIGEIRGASNFVHDTNHKKRRWFHNKGILDIGTSDTVTLRIKLPGKDIGISAALAGILGLGAPMIRYMAIMAYLIDSPDVPSEDVNKMAGILLRLRVYIEERADEAKVVMREVEWDMRTKPKYQCPRMSWENVIA